MSTPSPNTPSSAQQALRALAADTDDQTALDTLANSDVLLPIPDEAVDAQGQEAGTRSLPVLEQPDGEQLVPVFTSELRMAELLPSITHYHLVSLGVLAERWPADDLSLTIDASSPDAVTLNAEAVRNVLARHHR
jgi:hypothetical protein